MLLAVVGPAWAEPVKKDGVTVELVSEMTAVEPGRPVRLALVIRHDAGFHTYWRQPGIVGLTPTLTWKLPEGFTAGEILWPEPQRTKMAKWGVWGYERDVCLVTEVEPPASLEAERTPSVTFSAKAIWMACARTCHPGHADLTLTLPVRKTGAVATEWAPQFDKTRAEQPVELPAWKISAARTDAGFALTLVPPPGATVPEDVYFYSHGRLVDSDAPQKLERRADGSAVLRMGLVEFPDAMPQTLTGELWTAAGWKDGGKTLSRLLKVNPRLEGAAAPQ